VADFNHRFQVQAAERGTAFVPTTSRNPDRVFSLQFESLQFERRVNQDNTISCRNHTLQIAPARYPCCTATVHQHLDGTWSITRGPLMPVRYTPAENTPLGEIPSLLNFTSGKNRSMGDENTEPRASMMSAAIPELAELPLFPDRLKRFATMVTTNRIAAG
jgi:hypothetical protein